MDLIAGNRYTVRVKPGSKKNEMKIEGETILIWVTAQAVDNKANEAIVKLLKKQYGIKSQVVRGEKSKIKIIEILA